MLSVVCCMLCFAYDDANGEAKAVPIVLDMDLADAMTIVCLWFYVELKQRVRVSQKCMEGPRVRFG